MGFLCGDSEGISTRWPYVESLHIAFGLINGRVTRMYRTVLGRGGVGSILPSLKGGHYTRLVRQLRRLLQTSFSPCHCKEGSTNIVVQARMEV